MKRRGIEMAIAVVFLLGGCGGNELTGGNGGASGGDNPNPVSCGGDPDHPDTCTYWTCMTVPSQYGNKTHCNATNPTGGQPPGPYTCPASGGGLYCPGPGAGGSGTWDCTATEFSVDCTRSGGSTSTGGSGGSTGGSGGATGGSGGATGGSGGGTGGTGGTGGAGTCGGVDQMNPGCAMGAQYIYLVDENNHFFRYNPVLPKGQRYMDLGVLTCPATGTCADGITPVSPFSMAVDRNAIAWVLYCDGSIFKVDINNNIACTATSFTKNQSGFQVFGMGFSTDVAGMAAETLYIGGGAYSSIDMGTAQFGKIAMPALSVSSIGNVANGWPELTGTGDAQLWGFFPSDTGTPRVAQLNKTNGADLMSYNVPTIVGMPQAWAFGFFCDGFYIFLKRATDASTIVYHVTRMTGVPDTSPFDDTPGHSIVGAGVSTCAPIVGVHYDQDGNVFYDQDYQP